MSKPTVFIGDFHGGLERLHSYLDRTITGANIVLLGDCNVGYDIDEDGTDNVLAGLSYIGTKTDNEIYFLRGNHDNMTHLWDMVGRDDKERIVHDLEWYGYDRVRYMDDGAVVTLPIGFIDRRFIALGGAYSIDRLIGVKDQSWWEHEVTTPQDHMWAAYNAGGCKGDAIKANDPLLEVYGMLTHDIPMRALSACMRSDVDHVPSFSSIAEIKKAREYHQKLDETVLAIRPKVLIHGHMHRHYTFGGDGTYIVGLGNVDGTHNQRFYLFDAELGDI